MYCCFFDLRLRSDHNIGDTGAAALAKALASGQCQLESLGLHCSLFIEGESMRVLPHSLLGQGLSFPQLLCVGGGRGRGVDADRLRVYSCVLTCARNESANHIGDAGGVALAKALESGRCQLETLMLWGESMRVLHDCIAELGHFFVRLP